jgi:hypothetical protein
MPLQIHLAGRPRASNFFKELVAFLFFLGSDHQSRRRKRRNPTWPQIPSEGSAAQLPSSGISPYHDLWPGILLLLLLYGAPTPFLSLEQTVSPPASASGRPGRALETLNGEVVEGSRERGKLWWGKNMVSVQGRQKNLASSRTPFPLLPSHIAGGCRRAKPSLPDDGDWPKSG